MDLATILGLVVGLGCIAFAVVADGGNFGLFLNIPAITIVVGGTFGAALIHFSAGQMLSMSRIMSKAIFHKLPRPQDVIQKMVNYSAIHRRDGALALQQQLATAGEPFLVRAVQMLIDGQSEEAIEKQLALEIQYLQERHADGKKMMEFMGAACPAFGMVGTLIGLVQMFSSMESPDQIGAGMSVALVCTFQGAFIANLFFIPLGGKLGIRSKHESMYREMVLEGVQGIARGESPSGVREKMQAFISGRHREDLKPKV